MNTDKHYLTKEKYDELRHEIENLRTVGRKEVAENLEYTKQLGDLAENAEYHNAREQQAILEDKIARLDALLKSAVIVEAHHTDSVNIGSTVEVQKEGKKDTATYTIVGSEETDTSKNHISNTSPLGVAMNGKKRGDKFVVSTPTGKITYTIVNIA